MFPLVVLIAAALIASACSGGTSTSYPEGAATTSAEATTTAATATPQASATSSTAPPTTLAKPEHDFSAISPIVQQFVDDNDLNGAGLVIVEEDQGVVYEDYWGVFDAERLSLIASSSKMIAAGVLLRLQDDGLLDINAPVANVVDWGNAHPDVTPAELISNSSGLVGLLPEPAYAPYLCQYIATGDLQGCAKSIFTTPDDDADVIPPDTEFRYGGAQWQAAGAVAEAASGKSWSQLIDEIYVQPCGVGSLAFNNHFTQLPLNGFEYPVEFNSDPSTLVQTDNPNMEGGAYINPGDYAKLLLMHLRGGRCGETRVLSQDALDAMHEDRIGRVYSGTAGDSATGYGMGWWVHHDSGIINDPGAYGTVPWLDLKGGFGAYLVIEASAGTGGDLASLLYGPVAEAVAGN